MLVINVNTKRKTVQCDHEGKTQMVKNNVTQHISSNPFSSSYAFWVSLCSLQLQWAVPANFVFFHVEICLHLFLEEYLCVRVHTQYVCVYSQVCGKIHIHDLSLIWIYCNCICLLLVIDCALIFTITHNWDKTQKAAFILFTFCFILLFCDTCFIEI